MLSESRLVFLRQIARAVAKQFGENCEVLVHNVDAAKKESHIAVIENGYVSSRNLGDGPSHVVLEALNSAPEEMEDHLGYLTRTHDGRILKSTTTYIKGENGELDGLFSINFDITSLLTVDNAIQSVINIEEESVETNPPYIPLNVNDLLEELIQESVRLVGKPVALMTKDDKIKAIRFLNEHGAMLITKSGDKISKFFNISKYTLYSYIDSK